MESLSSRLKSFNKSKPSKSSKSTSPSWPHPTSFAANANTLAEAGFYFSPSAEDPDNVVCFMCEKELGGWEENDNPFDIHVEKSPKCAWALARCSLERDLDAKGKFIFKDVSRLPSNKQLEKARLDTFGGKRKWWPHDSNKTHGATSRKLAKAGFVYTPQESGVHDDTATCFYCDLSLSGWDPEDDPTTEHKKREERSGKGCPFFSAAVSTSRPANSTRKSKAQVASKEATPDSPDLSPSEETVTATALKKSTSANAKQSKPRIPAKSKATSREASDQSSSALKKSSKGKKPAQSAIAEEIRDDEAETAETSRPPPMKQSTKRPASKKGKKLQSSRSGRNGVQDDDDERGSRSRYEDHVMPMEEEGETEKPKVKGRSSRARSKSKTRTDDERPASRASTRSTRAKVTTNKASDSGKDSSDGPSMSKKPSRTKNKDPSPISQESVEDTPIKRVLSLKSTIDLAELHSDAHVMQDVTKNFVENLQGPKPSMNSSNTETALPAETTSGSRDQGLSNQMDVDVEDVVSSTNPQTPTRLPSQTTSQSTAESPEQPGFKNATQPFDVPAPFLPPLADSPMKYTTELSETEKAMTVEEYIRYQMKMELEKLRADGQRTIENFRLHAAEVRARIEAL